MCGRVVCYSPLDEISAALGAISDLSAAMGYQPSYNIPPSQPLPIVCQLEGDKTRQRRLLMAKWGLLPHWAKDEAMAFKTFNARAETVREKPSFRGAFKYRRCLIPVNGYYEWQRSKSSKLPYYFSRADSSILVLAGLFEIWKEELVTCTIITTAANEIARDVHDRMPVVLEDRDWQSWLEASPNEAYGLLRPTSDDMLKHYRVDSTVNSVKNDDSSLIAPLQ